MSKSIGFRLRNEALNENRTPTVSIDEKYGIYRNLEEACLKIPITQRSIGLTVCIETAQGIVKEYWWQETIADEGLVKKYDEEEIISLFNEIDTINERLDLIKNIQFRIVEELPLVGEENIRYLVSNGIASGDNKYDEYFWLVEEQRYEKYGGINASGSIIINNNYDFNSDHFTQSTSNYITTVSLKNPLGSLIASSGNLIRFANTTTGIIESVTGADFYIGKSNKNQGIIFNDDRVNIKGNVKINDSYPVLSGSNGLAISGNVMFIDYSGSISFSGNISLGGSIELRSTHISGSTVGSITHSGSISVLCGANNIYITSGYMYFGVNSSGSLSLYGTNVNISGNTINISGNDEFNVNVEDITLSGTTVTIKGSDNDVASVEICNNNRHNIISIDSDSDIIEIKSTNEINLSGSSINLYGSNINLTGNTTIRGDINLLYSNYTYIKKDNDILKIFNDDRDSKINIQASNKITIATTDQNSTGKIHIENDPYYLDISSGGIILSNNNRDWKFDFNDGSFHEIL